MSRIVIYFQIFAGGFYIYICDRSENLDKG